MLVVRQLFLGKLLPKPKLYTKFEVVSFNGCRNKLGFPNFYMPTYLWCTLFLHLSITKSQHVFNKSHYSWRKDSRHVSGNWDQRSSQVLSQYFWQVSSPQKSTPQVGSRVQVAVAGSSIGNERLGWPVEKQKGNSTVRLTAGYDHRRLATTVWSLLRLSRRSARLTVTPHWIRSFVKLAWQREVLWTRSNYLPRS